MNVRITGANLIISLKIKRIIRSKFIQKLDQLLPQFNDELKTASLQIQKNKKYKNYMPSLI
jgi:activator of HSP90 ATPase